MKKIGKWVVVALLLATGIVVYQKYKGAETGLDRDNPISSLVQDILPSGQEDLSNPERSPAPTDAPEPAEKPQEGDELLLLVNAWNPMGEDDVPQDLTNLYTHKDRAFELARSDIELRQCAYEAAQTMFLAAREDGVSGFILTSGYRSREAQQAIWDERQDDTVNRPGESEHESGLAFDVTAMNSQGGFEKTEQFAWLEENCWDYGFILRYPEDKEDVTGITYEPWHYRYVGVEAAQAMRASGETLEEYLDQTK